MDKTCSNKQKNTKFKIKHITAALEPNKYDAACYYKCHSMVAMP